nr:hypothetical protein [Bacilli bacterium]
MSVNKRYQLSEFDEKTYEIDAEAVSETVRGFRPLEGEKGLYNVFFIDGTIKNLPVNKIPGVKLKGSAKFEEEPKKTVSIALAKKAQIEHGDLLDKEEEPKEEAPSIAFETAEPAKEEAVIEEKEEYYDDDNKGIIPEAKKQDEEVPFGFEYVWQKENEDAPPFRDKDLVIACDGLGGAGGQKVDFELNEEDRKSFIRGAFVGMDLSEDYRLNEFCREIVEDVFSGDTTKKWPSQAALASRTIVSRFVYCKRHPFPDYTSAFAPSEKGSDIVFTGFIRPTTKFLPCLMDADLSDAKYRHAVACFLTYGLRAIIKEMDIPEPERGISLLAYVPSTLAAAIIRHHEDKIDIEVLWAGDSRIYCIDREKGFQQLSYDHEESNGGKMTNKFTGDKVATLDYAKYGDIPEDAIVFAASDGVFDPFPDFEPLGVKGNLVASMPELNKGFDFGQWRKNFFSRYGRFRDDDISIALSCFGYK